MRTCVIGRRYIAEECTLNRTDLPHAADNSWEIRTDNNVVLASLYKAINTLWEDGLESVETGALDNADESTRVEDDH